MPEYTGESPTSAIRGAESGFAVGTQPEGGVQLAWGRDGREPPGPGTTGDVVMAGVDAYSRYYRARAPDGAAFLLEVERDALDPDDFPVAWGPLSNSTIASIWRRRALAAVSDQEARGTAGPGLGFQAYPPLVLCREKAVLFHLPSPVTGRAGALEDCRDDGLLASRRLPPWSRSLVRFLWDGSVPPPAGEAFWSMSRDVPREAAASVGDFDRFARALGRLLDPANPASVAARSLRGAFPCIGCDQATRCYVTPSAAPGTQPLAPKRLQPVSMHPFHAIPHRAELMTFGEHADALGGATWTAFRARHAERWGPPGMRLARESLERDVFARVEAVDPLTAVGSKLALFESVVAQVLRLHRMHGHPHLALTPETVVSHQAFAARGETFDVSVRGEMRGPMLEDLMSPPPGPPVWLPPPGVSAPWAHASLVTAAESRRAAEARSPASAGDLRYGRPTQVRITAGRVWKDAASGATTCELRITVPHQTAGEVAAGDVLRIEVGSPGWEGQTLWARLDTEQISALGTLPLRTEPVALDSGQSLDLDAAARGKALFGAATVFHTWGAFYDVHALGMMLLRALLENSRNRFEQIARDVIPSILPLCRALQSGTPEARWEELIAVMERVVTMPPLDSFLSDVNACYFPGEIVEEERRVPARLWAEILATGLACITRTGGVAFATESELERDPGLFPQPLERLLAKVQSLREALPRRIAAKPAVARSFEREQRTGAIENPFEEENAKLRRSLEAEAARVKRLEQDVERLSAAPRPARTAEPVKAPEPARAPDPAVPPDAWRSLVEALAGAPVAKLPPMRPGEPGHDLVKAVAAEGLETLSVMLQALAELGGQEFAVEQRNLQRTVRQALAAAADGSPAARERVDDALRELRSARKRLGGAVGALVEAHGESTLDGTRRLLQTVAVALRKELDLKGSQVVALDAIIKRINDRTLELIAMLYDPPFQKRLRRHLGKADGREP